MAEILAEKLETAGSVEERKSGPLARAQGCESGHAAESAALPTLSSDKDIPPYLMISGMLIRGSTWTCPQHHPRNHHRRLWSGTSVVGGFRVTFKKARWKNILCQKTLTHHSLMEKGQEGYYIHRERKFTAHLVALQQDFNQILMLANPPGLKEK